MEYAPYTNLYYITLLHYTTSSILFTSLIRPYLPPTHPPIHRTPHRLTPHHPIHLRIPIFPQHRPPTLRIHVHNVLQFRHCRRKGCCLFKLVPQHTVYELVRGEPILDDLLERGVIVFTIGLYIVRGDHWATRGPFQVTVHKPAHPRVIVDEGIGDRGHCDGKGLASC